MTQRPLNDYLDTLQALLLHHFGPLPEATDWSSLAYIWHHRPNGTGYIQGLAHYAAINAEDLLHIEPQKQALFTNTQQFLLHLPANHVLLTGARGTGKSSLIRSLLHRFASQGLRIVAVEREHLVDLPQIMDILINRPERFVLFCDDLSFADQEHNYRALKVVLDGSLHAAAQNTIIYATSNRRHLLPKYMRDNLDAQHEYGEVHPAESLDEKIALSDRFGLWLSFHSHTQEQYLLCAEHWLKVLGCAWDDAARRAALQFAQQRAHRSGRSAWQFACDFAGKASLHASHRIL